ncbi:MAG: hypothetical protein QOF35_2044 [Actinomycetota bacterium]|jgi:hypothetical protein|nr:hypothetical protein [Actinomycetota bacterium]
MRSTYRVLAFIIAAEVAVQASAIAFGVFGLFKWVDDGNTLDKAAFADQNLTFPGLVGFVIHGINGQMVIPLLALIFLIVSFFAKVHHGVRWAGAVLAIVVIQVLLGMFAHGVPGLGLLHGLNALILFGTALTAGRRTSVVRTPELATAGGMTAQEGSTRDEELRREGSQPEGSHEERTRRGQVQEQERSRKEDSY